MNLPVSRTWQAAAMASLIEVLLIVAVIGATHAVPPVTPAFTPLVIEPVAEEVLPLPEPPPPKPPEPVIEPAKPVPVVRRVEARPAPAIEPVREPVAEPRAVPDRTEVATEPRIEPQPASVATPKVEIVDPAIAYNVALTQAVQATFRVPGAATSLGFKGRARIEFKLLDGKVSAITLILSSTLGAVDRAALKAVSDAIYPAPPAGLAGIMRTYQIWVECR